MGAAVSMQTPPRAAPQPCAGDYHTCGLTVGRQLYCWGSNSDGQLGDGTIVSRSIPTRVLPPIGASPVWVTIAAGDKATCAIDSAGSLYCWGNNADGVLGDGTTTDRWRPTAINNAVPYKSVALGTIATCAVPGTPVPARDLPPLPPAPPTYTQPACWGINTNNQFGDGSATTTTRYTLPAGNDTSWQAPLAPGQGVLSVSQTGACAVSIVGGLYCWGANGNGQVGVARAGRLEELVRELRVPPAHGTLTGATAAPRSETAPLPPPRCPSSRPAVANGPMSRLPGRTPAVSAATARWHAG